jgi:predicted permease
MHDLKSAIRQLRKNPGFTAVALLSLALGIGANTALFSVVYAVLISPYPYARPDEIWIPGLRGAQANQRMRPYPPAQYRELQRIAAFADVMGTSPGNVLLTGEYAPETLGGIRVTANAFDFLGVPPVAGRTIQPSDVRPNGEPEPVVMLSFPLWQRLFGGDASAIGKTLRLDDQPHTIVGVMPPRFGWWTSDGVWLPLAVDPREQRGLFPIARLQKGGTTEVARQQLHALQLQLAKDAPATFPREAFDSTLTNYMDMTVASGEMRTSLQLLFGAVALLLGVACANVANLQLARASARAREMAIRVSVGARPLRLVRQLLTESVALSLLGGSLGLLCAVGLTRLIAALMPDFYVPNEARITVNGYVLLVCLGVSLLTGILFGLAPALQSARPDPAEALNDAPRGSGESGRGRRTRAVLVVAEVALSVVLLVGAGLTVRSFAALQRVDLGFQAERLLMVGLPLPPKRYASWEQRNRFADELLQRVRGLPGVQAASIGNGGTPFGGPQSPYAIEGVPVAEQRRMTLHLVGADYLRTLGIPLVRGRMLSEQDVAAARPMAVVNEAAARLWPAGQDVIGRRVKLEALERPPRDVAAAPGLTGFVEVVGVMRDTRNGGLRNDTQPALLLPYTLIAPSQRTLAFRSQADPRLLLSAVRAQVQALDKEQPLGRPSTIEEVLGRAVMQPRFTMALFSLFALLGLSLAAAGVYSVLSYLVASRTREIGVRVALGAARGDVLRMVFRTGGGLVGVGLIVGVAASLFPARLLQSQLQLFQTSASDPLLFGAVALLLVVVAGAACYVPARRATRVDPMVALRSE